MEEVAAGCHAFPFHLGLPLFLEGELVEIVDTLIANLQPNARELAVAHLHHDLSIGEQIPLFSQTG